MRPDRLARPVRHPLTRSLADPDRPTHEFVFILPILHKIGVGMLLFPWVCRHRLALLCICRSPGSSCVPGLTSMLLWYLAFVKRLRNTCRYYITMNMSLQGKVAQQLCYAKSIGQLAKKTEICVIFGRIKKTGCKRLFDALNSIYDRRKLLCQQLVNLKT